MRYPTHTLIKSLIISLLSEGEISRERTAVRCLHAFSKLRAASRRQDSCKIASTDNCFTYPCSESENVTSPSSISAMHKKKPLTELSRTASLRQRVVCDRADLSQLAPRWRVSAKQKGKSRTNRMNG